MKRRERTDTAVKSTQGSNSKLRAYLAALVVSFVLCWILLVLGALLITYAGIPKDYSVTVAAVAAAVSSFVGGFMCARRIGSGGLVMGVLFGALLFVVIYIVGAICFDAAALWQSALLRLAVMAVCGGIGGIIGVNGNRKRS